MARFPHRLSCASPSRFWLLLACAALLTAYAAWHERSFIRHLVHETRVHYFGHTSPWLGTEKAVDEMYAVLQREEQAELQGAIRLSFCGDLILLRDAAENGYDEKTGTYDFSHMFKEVSEYWKTADLSVGVFEGPMAGKERGYSTSSVGDGIPLYLNFPDQFAQNIKDAGIGLVTTANNHLLDQGEKGALRTLDILDKAGLDHLGSYRTPKEHDSVKIRNIRGKKIAFIAYTYGCNYIEEGYFFSPEHQHLTRILVTPASPNLEACRRQVKDDFKRIRAEEPDAIVVLPHIGTQFLHTADDCQQYWTDVFVQEGADVIMEDHAHAVQPIEWRKKADGRHVLVSHCPGNFVNSYTPYDGDASMLVEAYLDPESGEPFAAAVIPIYAYCGAYSGKNRGWQGLPLYKAFRLPEWQNRLSRYEELRLQAAHETITDVALGHKLSADQAQERYYIFAEKGYKRNPVPALPLTPEDRDSAIVKAIHEAHSVAFVGDSVTEGTKNGGYGWFEPLASAFPEKNFLKFAKGSMTSCWFRENSMVIANLHADLYVLAFGCNDIRYRNAECCAMTAADYIANVDTLVRTVSKANPKARFALVAPWQSAPHDPVCKCPKEEKDRLYVDYTLSLQRYCQQNDLLYINPNPYICKKRAQRFWGTCMKDHIHPDAHNGIHLYSEGVVKASSR